MKVLIIKTTSLGDVIHTLPAIKEASLNIKNISFDWVVENTFAEIPKWSENVNKVYEVSVRAWRKKLYSLETFKEIRKVFKKIRSENYDIIIDAQGLFKSALITKLCKGSKVYGLDKSSAREGIASFFYQNKINVERGVHAVIRTKILFSKIFNYKISLENKDYGTKYKWSKEKLLKKEVIFLHGTTWKTKFWDLKNWENLAHILVDNGYFIFLPWGNEKEKNQALKIQQNLKNITVLPKMSLTSIAEMLSQKSFVISVDTGLSHLAASCGIPSVSIYGPTSSVLTGAMGENQIYLQDKTLNCVPCFKKVCKISKKEFAPCMSNVNEQEVFNNLKILKNSLL